MRNIKKRHMNIIKKLYYTVSPISTEVLCKSFDVSIRTIRYDMAIVKDLLDEMNVELVVKMGVGYSILNRDKSKLSVMFSFLPLEDDADSRVERKNTLLYTLFVQRRSISLTQLAQRIYLSESATSKYVHEINDDFTDQQVTIESSNHGYMLAGDESIIRTVMAEKIMECVSKHYNLLDYYEVLPKEIKNNLSPERFKFITVTLDRVNHQFHVWLSQHAYMKLIAAIITIEIRLSLGFYVKHAVHFQPNMIQTERHYTEFLFEHLFDINQNLQEINGFISFLIHEGIVVLSEDGNTSHVSNALVAEIMDYLNKESCSQKV